MSLEYSLILIFKERNKLFLEQRLSIFSDGVSQFYLQIRATEIDAPQKTIQPIHLSCADNSDSHIHKTFLRFIWLTFPCERQFGLESLNSIGHYNLECSSLQ